MSSAIIERGPVLDSQWVEGEGGAYIPSSVVALEYTCSPGFRPSFSVVKSFVVTMSLCPHTSHQTLRLSPFKP